MKNLFKRRGHRPRQKGCPTEKLRLYLGFFVAFVKRKLYNVD
ncbi:MAG: hypothetical protein PF692_02975 [Kiritimatiellae bacterium]|nr:hypothetical protein [Kiritimatiellia bacterium]